MKVWNIMDLNSKSQFSAVLEVKFFAKTVIASLFYCNILYKNLLKNCSDFLYLDTISLLIGSWLLIEGSEIGSKNLAEPTLLTSDFEPAVSHGVTWVMKSASV